MKRLRSSEDLHSYGDKNGCKDSNLNRSSSSSHRTFYYKPDNVRKGLLSSSSSASRKGFDRYRDTGDNRGYGAGGDRGLMQRSESFCGSRRDFPKGFRSERDRSRREGSVSSWRRFGGGLKDFDDSGRGSRVGLEDRVVRSPKTLRDVKSPTWSKDSESEHSKMSEQSKMRSSSRGSRDAKSKSKSPSWSKDSESEQSKSEQSKSVEVKKTEELQVESRSSSEMEEGELEPEPMPETEPEKASDAAPKNEDQTSIPLDTDEKEIQTESQLNDTDTTMHEIMEELNKEEAKPEEVANSAEKVVEKDKKLPDVQNDPTDKVHDTKNEIETSVHNDNKAEESSKVETTCKGETKEGTEHEKPLLHEEEHKQDKGVDLETRAELHKEVSTENEVLKTDVEMTMETVTNNVKDKGKSVSVTASDVVHPSEDGLWNDRGPRDLTACSGDAMEGPSTRAFELFSRSPVRKAEKTDQSSLSKHKDGSLSMEELDLSLSLPNVLLPIGAHETAPAPGSPSQARSVQSLSTFRTNSEGFTASMSFSGNRSSFSWRLASGSFPQSQATWGISDGQAVKGQPSRVLESSSKMASGLDRQLSFHKQLSGQSRRHGDVRSPSQSVGSHDIGSNYSFDKKREMRDRSNGSLYRTASQKEQEQFQMGGIEFVETIIAKIVSEPVPAMAKKFHEMNGQTLSCLKESIREIMLSADKRGQILAFQKVLQNRSDITLEVLLKAHRVQLEILVALKMGLVNFIQLDNSTSSTHLAEIFLNLRCRNDLCRSQLPVDECDCKVCAPKNGFCRECMCLVCSKFDNASNTCSWVGCDVCLHWCHTECGLRESYIRNGPSATGVQGVPEMQFHCIACDHPSELFGFVKDVFLNVAKDWSVEALCKELEYVKRIFSASKDMRGRQLHGLADQMLLRLANKSNLQEVYSQIMSFLNDGDSSKLALTRNFSGKEQIKEKNAVAEPCQEAAWMKSIYSEKTPLLERPANNLSSYDRNDKRAPPQELQMNVQKDYCFDELESIIKIKLAEAKMFQTRADDARREAEGLKRIALSKNEKIEEEYASRLSKLRLAETEEMRKQKFEEHQALERAHLEYFNMKMRMEADIKDLLLKMEATKRSLAM
ncbi:hypothetical protein K1719_012292 [Acacia pycnantha]|nr:hypothetical protein K1719_012292 [Acacia pycnantha]